MYGLLCLVQQSSRFQLCSSSTCVEFQLISFNSCAPTQYKYQSDFLFDHVGLQTFSKGHQYFLACCLSHH